MHTVIGNNLEVDVEGHGIQTAVLGFPRIGPDRELKQALESFWRDETTAAELEQVASGLRRSQLNAATAAGIDVLPSNDFSLYDHVLDAALLVGAVPDRFAGFAAGSLELMFAMARGAGETVPLEMTKWYDTNYHYLVPEIGPGTDFALHADKPLGELADAPGTRPVLVGPVSLLTLAKGAEPGARPLDRLEPLLDVYAALLEALHRAGATEVQIDEPCLVGDVGEDLLVAVERSWDRLAAASPGLELALITYFGGLGGALERVLRLPADEFHLDLVRAPEQLEPALAAVGGEARLSLGVIDGRNVWRSDLEAIIDRVEPALDRLGAERLRSGSVLLAAARPLQRRTRAPARSRAAELARLRRREARGAVAAQGRPRRRRSRAREPAGAEPPRARGAAPVGARGRPGGGERAWADPRRRTAPGAHRRPSAPAGRRSGSACRRCRRRRSARCRRRRRSARHGDGCSTAP